jgi:hypothetical protein
LWEAIRKWKGLLVEIVPLASVDPALQTARDHDLIQSLHDAGVEGLITHDDDMVFLPEVLRVIEETGFSVVTVRQPYGSDPMLATGLVFAHMREIAEDHERGTDQIWRLGTSRARAMSVAEHTA